MSYNARFPMPTGGSKFTRHHGEGLQSGKFFDTTVTLLQFLNLSGNTMGMIFSFGCRLAVLVNDKYISPDWVGTARTEIERQLDGKPAMFVQGFCSDVNCHYFFGTPEHAKSLGRRLAKAVEKAMVSLTPLQGTPLRVLWNDIPVYCRPMYTQEEIVAQRKARLDFLEEIKTDPAATWYCGYNLPEQMPLEGKINSVRSQLAYLEKAAQVLKDSIKPPSEMTLPLGVLRIGDVAALLSPGGNFTCTGRDIRHNSPFLHTLICGETNGIFGYMGPDEEIERGGYETDIAWKVLTDGEFRLAPAKGTVQRVLDESNRLLWQVR
jgi:hypothetical protein